MKGHDLTITTTNAHHFVPACQCGWYGTVHVPALIESDGTDGKYRRDDENARRAATAEHRGHVGTLDEGKRLHIVEN